MYTARKERELSKQTEKGEEEEREGDLQKEKERELLELFDPSDPLKRRPRTKRAALGRFIGRAAFWIGCDCYKVFGYTICDFII
jgi:hypothetical protein